MTVSEFQNVPIGRYIFQRLSQVNNLRSIFGVPGDFNLPLLEHLYDVPGLNWIGNCNELNAAYAADGYARLNKLGVVVTTYGVGELSALNGISGAFAEYSPVLSIVGTSRTSEKSHSDRNLHHLISHKQTWKVEQDHYVYEKLVEPFCVISESITADDLSSIQDKIDNVIETIYKQSRPGYLFLPVDLANTLIPVDPEKPLNLNFTDSNPAQSKQIVEKILDKIYTSKNFAILADTLIKHRAAELNKFVEDNSIHRFSTTLGKSILNETDDEFYHGIYNNELSTLGTNELIKQFDLVLHLGYNFNEVNNYKNIKVSKHVKNVVEIGLDFVRINDDLFTDDVSGYVIFDRLVESFDPSKLPTQKQQIIFPDVEPHPVVNNSSSITQASMVPIIEKSLKPNDVIVVEMCSFLFSVPDIKFPKNASLITQNFYGSIGYALPATLGASLAIKDSGSSRRVLLIEGDGSSQMTIQELTNFVRYDVKPTVLLLNNEGYSVERVIMGETRSYNDIAPNWNWTGLFKVFGDVDNKSTSLTVETNDELIKVLSSEEEERLRLIEVKLDRLDVGWRFHYIVGKGNAQKSK